MCATATFGWPYYHSLVVRFSITFWPVLRRSYETLEILDWLPLMEYWPRHKKVGVIESVRRSIEQIYARRRLDATSARQIYHKILDSIDVGGSS